MKARFLCRHLSQLLALCLVLASTHIQAVELTALLHDGVSLPVETGMFSVMLGFSFGVIFCLLFGILLFLGFFSRINSRIKRDRELSAIAQKTANHNLEKYQALYENAVEGLFTAHVDGRLHETNPALKNLLALSPVPRPSSNQHFLQSYFVEPHRIWENINTLLCQQGVIDALEIQGYNAWYSLSARRMDADNRELLIKGSLIDITQRKHQEQQLVYLASRDLLTNLYNRNQFEKILQSVILSQGVNALLFIDVDQFKVINDTCGHAAGDECLRQISDILKAHVRPEDLLARLGGDEFAIIFKNEPELTGKWRAEQLRQALEANYFQWQQRIFKTSVSIGLVVLDSRIHCAEQALSLVDAACYEAKETGRNRVIVDHPKKQETIYRRCQMDMVATLNLALRDHQLTLFQQPIIALNDRPTGVMHYEMLIRLRTVNGLLQPSGFLPAAQRYHLLPQIDRWVFNKTCEWLAVGQNLAKTALANVNLSPQTLGDPAFTAFVKGCLDEYSIPPSKVCFEITEYNALSNLTVVLRHIMKLRELGVRFALDDFGSGFASFDYVKRLPVDFIKIDGQFVADMKREGVNKAIVQAITEIAHSLGKQVIAESIEDQETVKILRDLEVDLGQGFYLGEPVALYSSVASAIAM